VKRSPEAAAWYARCAALAARDEYTTARNTTARAETPL